MNSTLSNTYNLLKNKKKLTIGFLGGSITYGSSAERVIENGQFIPDKKGDISDSYANRVVNWFKSQYPDAQIEAVNSGVAGTHSQLGLYRLEKTLMNECGHSMPDLIFIEFTSNDWIYPEHTAEITKTEVEGLDVLPSHIDLVGAEIEMLNLTNREQILKKVLYSLKEEYDYILIDCSPSLGLITVNALTAADSVIIPVQCEYFALEGISKLLNTIKIIKSKLNPALEIEGFLLTMYDSRLRLANQIYEEVKRPFRDLVFTTVIQRNVKLSEASSYGKPVLLYDAESKGARNHMQLAQELIEKNR